jgi:phospholipase C
MPRGVLASPVASIYGISSNGVYTNLRIGDDPGMDVPVNTGCLLGTDGQKRLYLPDSSRAWFGSCRLTETWSKLLRHLANKMQVGRREFAKYALLVSGEAMLCCARRIPPQPPIPRPPYPGLPDPASSGIEHVVVVTMENRSFDHLLGWLPNADGKQADLSFYDKNGESHRTQSLSGEFTGCPHPDPDHSYNGSRVAYDGGKMDGFLRAGSNDIYSIGYYGEKDIPFYAALARNYTACDRYYASILGPTFANRMFLYAAQTDRTTDSIDISSLPTIFDRLAAAQVTHNYYYSNVPYLALHGMRMVGPDTLIALAPGMILLGLSAHDGIATA